MKSNALSKITFELSLVKSEHVLNLHHVNVCLFEIGNAGGGTCCDSCMKELYMEWDIV